jgi:hypothetical protein
MMVVAKKKITAVKRVAKTPAKRKTTSAISVQESQRLRLMIISFTLLSFLFSALAFWRYG